MVFAVTIGLAQENVKHCGHAKHGPAKELTGLSDAIYARFKKNRLHLLNISRMPHGVGKQDSSRRILWFGFHKICGNSNSRVPILCC